MKSYNTAKSGGKLQGSVAYIADKGTERSRLGPDMDLDGLVAAYKHRAAR